MSGTVSPVQSRRLARTLRRWRERSGYSVERAAEELLCGSGTVSRMESGDSAEPLRVKAALELYGAPAKVVADMVQAAKDRRRKSVLRRSYHDFAPHTLAEYLDLEYEASELSCYQGDIVHGLLQTEDYIRAVMDAAGVVVAPGDRNKFVQLRMERQERLRDDQPLALRVILVESALYTEIGGKAVLRDQLQHLLDLHETASNIEIRVMPFAMGGHPAVSCNFAVLAFPGAGDKPEPEAICTENAPFFLLHDDPEDVTRFQRIYDQVWEMALDPVSSADVIQQAINRLVE